MVTLSVLDQSPIRKGGTAAQAIDETFQLAQLTDRLGYHRYWLAEHHNTGSLACTTPEILIGQVASRTHRIRVGSGGVMLTHYSPLKVAENFRMLETLFPGRIDLGIGRAPGSDGRTAAALAHGPGQLGIEHYPDQIADLTGYLVDSLPEQHPFRGVRAMPDAPTCPEPWLLGSTRVSAQFAADLGWGFSFAHFISPEGGEDVFQLYRERFEPSPLLAEPRASMGVSVTCADSEEEAVRLSWSRWVWRILAAQGYRGGIISPEEAMSLPLNNNEREYIDYMRSLSIHGTPDRVREKLLALGERYGVDEFVVVTITHDFTARLRSYELLAAAFGLEGAAPLTAASS
jgi:luciferase family oxidoreductase group 1